MISRKLIFLGLAVLLFADTADATMRCGTALISLGDTTDVVRQKCGAPDSSVDQMPALRSNGVPKLGTAKVSLWLYGPRNGAKQHLRFVEDKLVEIETKRD
ncbi:DUF2845 domain-containing protein [Pseudomonas petrae]|uniref:DUF2845 domain-containing protein n=1 Tax=Pseudomonas petrae TaxID=2912190 RepID=A0ABS9HYZ8_9PSED|nr:DUF2845 domain-containing protein [Pseudomonas petrae]MCF7531531.1 DUF2845 domain-containing protein [Pseudomonas petrae]MCF7537094.1 DUF2845 domain-containing protein [Pseudomonas petrae]MCF7540770.1 DUF2845 domain-containing protein [Pseudomonas petrae]MCF7556446.1 DUF2845 domain-containing protein [Pseudomonas petrae]